MTVKKILIPTVLGIHLAACTTTFEEKRIDYKSASQQQAPSLAVPPDLTQLPQDSRYAVPGQAVSIRDAMQQPPGAQAAQPERTALSSLGDVRMARNGAQRWLVVQRSPEQLWDAVRDFWLELGFVFATEERQLGILETDWAENRAKLPQDIIRRTLGRVFDSLYSTGERDRFRTRLERTAEGTEVYITHRGMEEVYTSTQQERTIWQPRPVDHELEAEFLRRLMLKLGASQEQADAALAQQAPGSLATRAGAQILGTGDEETPTLHLAQDFTQAWRRVGLALDRSGFTVEDRDRSHGMYYVRYVPPLEQDGKGGFFSRLWRKTPGAEAPTTYQIQIRSQEQQSRVSVHDGQGVPENSQNARRILELLLQGMQ